jgi:hypothetical protein
MALRVVVSRGLLFLKILGIRFDAVGLMAFLYCLFKLCFHIFCQFSLINFISYLLPLVLLRHGRLQLFSRSLNLEFRLVFSSY